MTAHGLDSSPWLEVPFIETAVQKICRLLQHHPRPTALVCSNDLPPMLSTAPPPNTAMGRCAVALRVQALIAGLPLAPSASVSPDHAFRIGESYAPFSRS